LYREIIAVNSENNIKYTGLLYGQNSKYVYVEAGGI
jgi:hypothetical protein